jgi:hypothetical protein
MDTLVLANRGATIEIGGQENLGDTVRTVRRMVFCEEEGYLEDMVETPLDRLGVHIVVRFGGQPVACVSVIPPEHARGFAGEVRIPVVYAGRAALITKMAVVSAHRKSKLTVLMVACLERFVFDPRGYRYAFVVLKGRHLSNERFYQRLTGAERVAEGRCSYGEQVVLIIDREAPTYRDIKKNILDVRTKEWEPKA